MSDNHLKESVAAVMFMHQKRWSKNNNKNNDDKSSKIKYCKASTLNNSRKFYPHRRIILYNSGLAFIQSLKLH